MAGVLATLHCGVSRVRLCWGKKLTAEANILAYKRCLPAGGNPGPHDGGLFVLPHRLDGILRPAKKPCKELPHECPLPISPVDHPETSHHWHPGRRCAGAQFLSLLRLCWRRLLAVLNAWNLWPFAGRRLKSPTMPMCAVALPLSLRRSVAMFSAVFWSMITTKYARVRCWCALMTNIYRGPRIAGAGQSRRPTRHPGQQRPGTCRAQRRPAGTGTPASPMARAPITSVPSRHDPGQCSGTPGGRSRHATLTRPARPLPRQRRNCVRQTPSGEIARQDVRTVDVGRDGLKGPKWMLHMRNCSWR